MVLYLLYKLKDIFYKLILYCKIRWLINKNKKRVFLIGTPWYGNLGDHAITLGEIYILKEVFSDCKIIDIPYNIYFSRIGKLFGFNININDIIFLQGGGNLGSLYPQEENLRRDVISKYKKNKIVIMPVSIFFHNNNFGKNELDKSQKIYNAHFDLTIISRDEISYAFAKKYFNKVNNILAPDVVTSLNGIISDKSFKRCGIQFFLRKDIEKILSDDVTKQIEEYLRKKNIQYNVSDTTVPYEVKEKQRKKEVFSKLILARKAKLVITDRYHGLIFSVITHTPVIVFKSFDTKISSGVKWFKDLDWVYYLDSNEMKKIFNIIDLYCDKDEHIVKNISKCKETIFNAVKNC